MCDIRVCRNFLGTARVIAGGAIPAVGCRALVQARDNGSGLAVARWD